MLSPSALADQIEAVLPQTQCTKCGYAGCRPYAEAIVAQRAEINQCPPGGRAGVAALAQLTGRTALPLNPEHGAESALRLAVIDEALCIGCALCVPACPVDAIVGAARRMHTVIASACTGCDLCVAPCPMDCIRMEPVRPERPWTTHDGATARARFGARNARLAGASGAALPATAASSARDAAVAAEVAADVAAKVSVEVAAALARARLRRTRAAGP